MNKLNEIILNKKIEIEQRKLELSLEDLIDSILSMPALNKLLFKDAIKRTNKINIIAEIKKASPSAGIINDKIDILDIAKQYEQNGASAISVLTDKKYFSGSLDFLQKVSTSVVLPCLCKDFIIDEYQIYEAKKYLASSILLIANVLEKNILKVFLAKAKELGLDALLEIHDENDLRKIENLEFDIVGINNRCLENMSIDINRSIKLKKYFKNDRITVSESGIYTKEDVRLMSEAEFDAVLVGTSLMRGDNPGEKLKQLLNF